MVGKLLPDCILLSLCLVKSISISRAPVRTLPPANAYLMRSRSFKLWKWLPSRGLLAPVEYWWPSSKQILEVDSKYREALNSASRVDNFLPAPAYCLFRFFFEVSDLLSQFSPGFLCCICGCVLFATSSSSSPRVRLQPVIGRSEFPNQFIRLHPTTYEAVCCPWNHATFPSSKNSTCGIQGSGIWWRRVQPTTQSRTCPPISGGYRWLSTWAQVLVQKAVRIWLTSGDTYNVDTPGGGSCRLIPSSLRSAVSGRALFLGFSLARECEPTLICRLLSFYALRLNSATNSPRIRSHPIFKQSPNSTAANPKWRLRPNSSESFWPYTFTAEAASAAAYPLPHKSQLLILLKNLQILTGALPPPVCLSGGCV